MFAIYTRQSPHEFMLRKGHRVKALKTAMERAKKLAMTEHEVEVRDEALPRSRSLQAIFHEGRQVAA